MLMARRIYFILTFLASLGALGAEEPSVLENVLQRLEYLEDKAEANDRTIEILRRTDEELREENDKLRTTIVKLAETITKINGALSTEDISSSKRFVLNSEGPVAFSAGMVPIAHLKTNDIIKFETTITDIGGGYNNQTGVFVAPRSGIYMFSCSLLDDLEEHGLMVHAEIVHGQRILARIFAHAEANIYRDQGAQTVFVHVSQGDQVFVRVIDNDNLGLGAAGRLKMIQEPSITNRHFLDGRLGTFPVIGSLSRCISECSMDSECVSIAFSRNTTSCQLYNFDVANFTVNAIVQDDTFFFRVVCERHDYTYIRYLNMCMRLYYREEAMNGSMKTCENDNAHLLQLDTVDKMEYMERILNHIYDDVAGFFLGGYAIENSTEYFWFGLNGGPDVAIENENSGYFWGAAGPDHCELAGGCCLSLQYDGRKTSLASANCVDNLMFICVVDM